MRENITNAGAQIGTAGVWRLKPSLWASYYYLGLIGAWFSLFVAGYVHHVFGIGLMSACVVGLLLCTLVELPHWRATQTPRVLRFVEDSWQLEKNVVGADAITTTVMAHRERGEVSVLLTTPFCLRLKISTPFYVWRDQLTAAEWRMLRSHCAVQSALAALPDRQSASRKDG